MLFNFRAILLALAAFSFTGSLQAAEGSHSSSDHQQGSWQPLTNQPTFLIGANQQLLLTDGSVLVPEIQTSSESTIATGNIWKLTPDIYGSYVNGTWTQLASLPAGYAPSSFAQAVLPDGRVIFEGGEVNGDNIYVWEARGAIYDPLKNVWTEVAPPPFFGSLYLEPPPPYGTPGIGDAASVVLEDGTFMLQESLSFKTALLDSKTLTWTETGIDANGNQTKIDVNDEEGWTLLPNGKVLTVDCNNWDYLPGNPFPTTIHFPSSFTVSEIYNPKKGTWSNSSGSTLVPLDDSNPAAPFNPDYGITAEIGPSVLRPDGKVIQFGATGFNAFYDWKKNKWSVAPAFPNINGTPLTAPDCPAALLPNGNVLVTAVPGFTLTPTYFFELTLKDNQFIPQPSTPNASTVNSGNMLILPTGQIFWTDGTTDIEIYTPGDLSYNPNWAPVITSRIKKVRAGQTYKIEGVRFNGMSQGSAFGDDYQSATNYPLIRITNLKTKHVFYCRTHDHSFMGVASKKKVHTHFDVPSDIEKGKAILEVVANGIPSKPVQISVK